MSALQNGTLITKDNIQIGTLMKVSYDDSHHSEFIKKIMKAKPQIDYFKILSVHNGAKDVVLVEGYDYSGKNVGKLAEAHVAVGYQGNFDMVSYSPITYDLEDMLSGLDKLADKIK